MAGVESVGRELIIKIGTQMWVLIFCDSMTVYLYEGQIMENLEAWAKEFWFQERNVKAEFDMIQR